jgi:hypothetical protein
MDGRHLCIFDLENPQKTFADRYPYPLFQYVQSPPKECDAPWIERYDFATVPLTDYIFLMQPVQGDVLEAILLDRRVEFQALQVNIRRAAPGLLLAPFTLSGATFDTIDCSIIGEATYLPFGGVLDRSTNLTYTSFVLDSPDYIGLRFVNSVNINPLHIELTVLFSETFSGLGKSNRNLFP